LCQPPEKHGALPCRYGQVTCHLRFSLDHACMYISRMKKRIEPPVWSLDPVMYEACRSADRGDKKSIKKIETSGIFSGGASPKVRKSVMGVWN
jgi:hypothetical protein